MYHQRSAFLILLAFLFALMGCANHNPAWPNKPSGPAALTFTSKQYGFSLQYPANLILRHTFENSYLDSANWKTFTNSDKAPGKAVVSLTLPGSNSVRAGELRIGISRAPKAIQNAIRLPNAARPERLKHIKIDGVNFITYQAGDAGMSHYLNVRSYRGVHNHICYAIDILIIGTNGQVYAPPRKPPFTKEYVLRQLTPVVASLKFFPPKPNSPVRMPLPAAYTGKLPCADCPGINYQLNLLKQQRYTETLDYQDRSALFTERGTWQIVRMNGKKILKLSGGQQWAIENKGKTLRLLNKSGHEIKSKLNFDLTYRRPAADH